MLMRVRMVAEVLIPRRRGARHSRSNRESSAATSATIAVGRSTRSVRGSTETVVGVVGGRAEVGTRGSGERRPRLNAMQRLLSRGGTAIVAWLVLEKSM